MSWMGGRPARLRTTRYLLSWSAASTAAAVPYRASWRAAGRGMSARPRAAAGVAQAQRGVGQRVQPLGLDLLAADLAAPVAAVVHAGQRALDLLDEVAQVADQG